MSNSDMGMTDEIMTQEELMEQKRLAQKKEKKIKVIRLVSVFAYLVSVSLVAGVLSAYYICIWNPRANNGTTVPQTINAERIVMALPMTNGDYAFDSNIDNQQYSDFLPEVLHGSRPSDRTESPSGEVHRNSNLDVQNYSNSSSTIRNNTNA